MMLKIPDEILDIVIKALGNPDRNLLLPLLIVSKRFYAITVPLLYASISSTRSQYKRGAFLSSTTVSSGRLNLLQRSLTRDPSLASFITTIIWHDRITLGKSERKSFRLILTLVPNLRRLSITTYSHSSSYFGRRAIKHILSPAAKLTHLSLPYGWDQRMCDLIRSQPSLEYLKLGFISDKTETPPATFPNIELPNLRAVRCDVPFLNLLEASSLEHLSLLTCGADVHSPQVLSTIRALRSFRGDALSWRRFARYCEVVEYVWVTTLNETYIEDILSAKSRRIKYLYRELIGKDSLRKGNLDKDSSFECPVLFNAFPELVVIDYNVTTCRRHTRGIKEPKDVTIFHRESHQFHWHEWFVDAVEEAVRKQMLRA
ncbi:hypothetical protein ONZ45_g13515 [Pleurotus djamor]|nr:hypothetical protein ONZ45_g13515 [Pleurotus djamor]